MERTKVILISSLLVFSLDLGASLLGAKALAALENMKTTSQSGHWIRDFNWQELNNACEAGERVEGIKLLKTLSYLASFIYFNDVPEDVIDGIFELFDRVEGLHFEVIESKQCEDIWCTQTYTFCNENENFIVQWKERN
jgi:hypothetical protein